ncbi:MAG: phenylalanine--tRNA ligase subunit beta [Burkholderiales bacterium]|nr:phenylalanine--tRNA ligase subunit beta [Burkholderiales bacterium]
MKFSEQWLRTFVDPALDTEALAHALTMAGLEVEEIAWAAPGFDGVVVAEVRHVGSHPDADRLRVCEVDAGHGTPRTVVCGAPDVAAGMRVPCALPGAKLPGGIEIREASVRGIASAGMLCSARELGLSDDASGLLRLPPDAPVGTDFRSYYDLDDRLLTLKLTSNRGDCLSVLGVARDAAALTGAALRPVSIEPVAPTIADRVAVRIEAGDACRRYCGRVVRHVNVGAATPLWMRRRLEKSGLRSIGAVVDVTNYVMLELGQPLHAFDLAKLEGDIHVRFARTGERLLCLNEADAALAPDYLVIADATGPVALAGIMGGKPTAVGDDTVDLFLESAFFEPQAIGGRSRRLGFASDSSHRFERGVDFGMAACALERATRLILECCGGEPGPITEALTELPARPPVRLRTARVPKLLGIDPGADAVAAIFERLSMLVLRDGDSLAVTPPSFRFDIVREEDLVEEVARVYGYDRIAPQPLATASAMLPLPETTRTIRELRAGLALRDYQEAVTYAFVDPAWEADFGVPPPLVLANPIASQMSVMRTTLLGGLVDRLRFNLNRRQIRVRLFEIGTVFLGAGGTQQPTRVGGLAYGPVLPEQWGSPARNIDFFDVKGDLEALCHPLAPTFEPAHHPALHPGRAARVFLAGQPVGWCGELHPRWQRKYELPLAPVMFELDAEYLQGVPVPTYQELSRFPSVRRDLALVVDEKVSAASLQGCLLRAAPDVVWEVVLFDVYRGKGLDIGKKSLAFRILLQDTQRTLTDEEADAAMAVLITAAEQEHGASLRS